MATKAKTNGLVSADGVTAVVIKPLNLRRVNMRILGTAPYVQLRFGEKAFNQIRETQIAGSTARGKKKAGHVARDFDADFHQAYYKGEDGHYGIPAASFRAALIRACKVSGFEMTLAKLSIFVQADSFDPRDGTALVHIEGEPQHHESSVRNANGQADIRVRAMWPRWAATLNIEWDADQFTESDVVNLLMRAGVQVGIGEGRPFSKASTGLGWGTFRVAGLDD